MWARTCEKAHTDTASRCVLETSLSVVRRPWSVVLYFFHRMEWMKTTFLAPCSMPYVSFATDNGQLTTDTSCEIY